MGVGRVEVEWKLRPETPWASAGVGNEVRKPQHLALVLIDQVQMLGHDRTDIGEAPAGERFGRTRSGRRACGPRRKRSDANRSQYAHPADEPDQPSTLRHVLPLSSSVAGGAVGVVSHRIGHPARR